MIRSQFYSNFTRPFRIIALMVLVSFVGVTLFPPSEANAQLLQGLPVPGKMVALSPSYQPLQLKGIQVFPDNPLRFDFLIDIGDSRLSGAPLKNESTRLIKYFLAALTVPEKDLWVNLSPYEKDRIAPNEFGVTEMGKDLLEQDYLLKQITASLIYPEKDLGKKFWDRVYAKAYEVYGTTKIPVNTFSKVWIVPYKAQVYVRGNSAFVTQSELNVMLEADYLALQKNLDNPGAAQAKDKKNSSQDNSVYANVLREIIVPELKKEVNEGKNFEMVRQVYNAVILATWFKRNLRESFLGKSYVRQNKIVGVDVEDRAVKERIFEQYLAAFQKGVYNYIRNDYDPFSRQTIARKYVSGGIQFSGVGLSTTGFTQAAYEQVYNPDAARSMGLSNNVLLASADLRLNQGGKQVGFPDSRTISDGDYFGWAKKAGAAQKPSEQSGPLSVMKGEHSGPVPMSMGKKGGGFEKLFTALSLSVALSTSALFFSPSPSHADDIPQNSSPEETLAEALGEITTALKNPNADITLTIDGKEIHIKKPADEFQPVAPATVKQDQSEDPSAVFADKISENYWFPVGVGLLGWIGSLALMKGKFKNRSSIKKLNAMASGTPPPGTAKKEEILSNNFYLNGIKFVGKSTASRKTGGQKSDIEEVRKKNEIRYHARLRPFPVFESLGSLIGAGVAIYSFGLLGVVYSLALPLITRLFYAAQLIIGHENVGHSGTALLLNPFSLATWKQAFSWSNLSAHLNWNTLFSMLVPFKSPTEKTASVGFLQKGWKDTVTRAGGFGVSLALGILGAWQGFVYGLAHTWLLPLLGPFAVSALSVIRSSFETDILSMIQKTSTSGEYKCGDKGIVWVSRDGDAFPDWVREGQRSLDFWLLRRGGQESGLATQTNGNGEPTVAKRVKNKRGPGSDLSKSLERKLAKLLTELKKGNLTKENEVAVRSLVGHVRFATGGKVIEPAAHPHLSPLEKKQIWARGADGRLKKSEELVVVFVMIKHNGDNDEYRILDTTLNTGQIRDFFGLVLSGKKLSELPPPKMVQDGHGIRPQTIAEIIYKDEEMAPGDSPPIAFQIHFLLNQGNWDSSVRYAYTMVKNDNIEEAMETIISPEEQGTVGQIFDEVFAQRYNNMPADLKDIWVPPEEVARNPHDPKIIRLKEFREAVWSRVESEMTLNTPAGKILKSWGKDEERLQRFCNVTIDRFFTADQEQAFHEFADNAIGGSYGLAGQSSFNPNGITLFARDQGLSFGWKNLGTPEAFFTYSSDHIALQGAKWGQRGNVEAYFLLKPSGKGEIVDLALNPDGTLHFSGYSLEKDQPITEEEFAHRAVPLNSANRYYSELPQYPDENEITEQDIKWTTSAIQKVNDTFNVPNSFNSETAEEWTEQTLSLAVEKYLKEHSEPYMAMRPKLLDLVWELGQNCYSGTACSEAEKESNVAELLRKIRDNSVVLPYMQERVDRVVSTLADAIAHDLMKGTVRQDQLFTLKRGMDRQLETMIRADMKKIVDTMQKNFETFLKEIKKDTEITPASEVPRNVVSVGFIRSIFNKMVELFSSPKKAKESPPAEVYDLYLVGYENSGWLNENLKSLIQAVMPQMKIWAGSSNKVMANPKTLGIGRRTKVMITTKSGATFPSLGIVDALRKLTNEGVFVTTSRVDSLASAAIGQEFYPDSPFLRRTFVTGNYYPAESATISESILLATQINMVLHWAKRMRQIFPDENPWGFRLSMDDINQLEQWRDQMVKDSERINGFDVDGKSVPHEKNKTNEALAKRGKYMGWQMTETPVVSLLMRAYVWFAFVFHGPLQLALGFLGADLNTMPTWTEVLVHSIDAFISWGMTFFITTGIYRSFTKRPRWARMGRPTMVIGDLPVLHQTSEQFVTKSTSYALGNMTPEVHGANAEDHFAARLAHRVTRGVFAFFGLPLNKDAKTRVMVTARQTKGIRNGIWGKWMQGGAEITTIGLEPFQDPDITDHHITIGDQDAVASVKKSSPLAQDFYHYSFEVFQRMLAYKILFHEMARGAMTLEFPEKKFVFDFLGIHLELTIKRKVFCRLGNIAFTFPSISVHTTRSPQKNTEVIYEEPVKLNLFDTSDKSPQGGSSGNGGAGGAQEEHPVDISVEHQEGVRVDGHNRITQHESPTEVIVHKDSAMLAEEPSVLEKSTANSNSTEYGGIDMDGNKIDLRQNGKPVIWVDRKQLETIPFQGVTPEIFQMVPVPVNQLYLLLGNEAPQHEKTLADKPLAFLRRQDRLYASRRRWDDNCVRPSLMAREFNKEQQSDNDIEAIARV